MACWLDQPTSNTDFCDAIDAIMKHEHEDVILLNNSLSPGVQLELDLDSISDLLENPSTIPAVRTQALSPMSPSSPTTADYTQPLNTYSMTPTSCATFPVNNNPQSNTTTASVYSSLGISPKFTT